MCGHSLDQHDISDEMMVCDIANCECDAYDGDQLSNTSKAEIAIAEARRSAIEEAIAKLKAKGVVPDNYVGIQDAIALLEKMI